MSTPRRISYTDLLSILRRLFNAQLHDNGEARAHLEQIDQDVKEYRRQRIHKLTSESIDPHLTLEQSWAIIQIMGEWQQMFAFSPGRSDGIPFLLELLDLVKTYPQIDIGYLVGSSAWQSLVAMKGPSGLGWAHCSNCHTEFVILSISGFVDMQGFVCDRCGNIWIQGLYDDTPIPPCQCSGEYQSGCPRCGTPDYEYLKDISSYEYFLTHEYHIKS